MSTHQPDQDSGVGSRHVLIFENLTVFNLGVGLIGRVLGITVRYYSISPLLAKRVDMLRSCGIRGLEFSWIENAQRRFYKKLTESAEAIVKGSIEGSPLFGAMIAISGIDSGMAEAKLRIALRNQVAQDLWVFNQLILFADEYFAGNPRAKVFLWAPCDFLRRAYRKWDGKRYCHLAVPGTAGIARLFRAVSILSAKMMRKLANVAKTASVSTSGELIPSKSFEPSKAKVLYFPHKGIFYGELYLKDHYYGLNKESHFHPSKILHLSLGEDATILKKTHDYYRKNNIPFADFFSFRRISTFHLVCSFVVFIRSSLRNSPLAGLNLVREQWTFWFQCWKQLKIYESCLEALPEAAIALVGYDILFPAWLSIALMNKAIPSVATQERMMGAWLDIQLPPLDHYFVNGQAVKNHLLGVGRTDITNIKPIGLVRLDLIHRLQGQVRDSKYDALKEKYEKIVLCLDFHSAATREQNRLLMTNHWRNNKRFYEDVLKLARVFPKACFVIKGKNNDFMNLPYFEDVVGEIKATSNVIVETDYVNYPPERIVSIADLGIGLYTSLFDEILAAKKPAVIYDYCGIPSAFYDYDGLPVIAKSFENLLEKIELIFKRGYLLTEQQQLTLERRFYENCYDGRVRMRLQEILSEIGK